MLNNKKNNTLYKEKYEDHIPCSFAYTFVCIDDKFSKKVVPYRRENTVYGFADAIFKEYEYCKKIIKKHFKRI